MPSLFEKKKPQSGNLSDQTGNKSDVTMNSLASKIGGRITEIKIDQIDEMPGNDEVFPIEEELIESLMAEIQANGFQVPVIVVPNGEDRYRCLSGHQRIEAMRRLGKTTVPADIKKGLSEKQQRDLWRSDNVLKRKLTPLMYARLVQTYSDDFDKYEMTGDKRDYIAKKLNIGRSSVLRYQRILKMPKFIQDQCGILGFPYAALEGAVSFEPDQMFLLETKLKEEVQRHENEQKKTKDGEKPEPWVIGSSELKALIEKVKDDTKYETDPSMEMPEKRKDGKDPEKEHFEKNYRLYQQEVEKKEGQAGRKVKFISLEEPLDKAARELYRSLQAQEKMIGNKTTAQNAIQMLKDCIKEIEKLAK